MRKYFLSLVLLIPFGIAAADWQPAKGPLLTKWAKDVSPDNVRPEYPRPTMVREEWRTLNGLWQFAVAKEGDEAPAGQDLKEQILVPFPVESALSGVMKRAERVWYRRTFEVKKDWADKRLLLHFGAVNWEAVVWVNGKKLATHQGGYDGFSVDITDALKKDGPQEVIVGVWNPVDAAPQPRGKQVRKPEGIYYTPSTGIWQTVWLEPVPKVSIESLKIVPDVDGGKVRVTVKARGDATGVEVHARVGRVDIKGKVGEAIEVPNIDAPDIGVKWSLWSPESPSLIDLAVVLKDGDKKTVDEVGSYFAMRKTEVKKDDKGVTRMFLNGKPYFQVGPLDQGFWPDGLYTAPTEAAMKYDIEVTKKLGFNMIRKHVKVEPEAWYYWCDKLGILVWQDMPSGERSIGEKDPDLKRTPKSVEIYERELKAMIDGRGNHPCIVMWVPFNEGWGQFDTARIVESVKKQDPTRLVDCASGWADRAGVGDVHDWHIYPGPGSPNPEEKRAAVLGEFGGLGLAVKGHLWDEKTWSYRGTRDSADLTRKYERLLQGVYKMKDKPGLSAAVYTQTTDVETEANGLLTYDRAVIKVDAERVAAANRGDFSRVPDVREIVPTSREKAQTWRYTLDKPAEGWQKSDFEDSSWKQGPGGFGTRGTPGAVVGTEWKTDDIWIRREFTLPEEKLGELLLLVHHDEDVEVYVNGVLALKVPGFIGDYEEFIMTEAARKALKPGKNVFAVHCHQTTGGQYIDVGIVDMKEKK